MTQAPTLDAIYVGLPKTITDDQGTWTSSIYRDRIEGPIELRKNGLVGNRVAQPYHGGPHAAVCVHLRDHYRFWNEHYDMALSPVTWAKTSCSTTSPRSRSAWAISYGWARRWSR